MSSSIDGQKTWRQRLPWLLPALGLLELTGCGESERTPEAVPTNPTGAAVPSSSAGPEPPPSGQEPIRIVDPEAVPSSVPDVSIQIDEAAQQMLEAAPWSATDVLGAFNDGKDTGYDPVELNYRGAFALQSLIASGSTQRNWKVKFSELAPYLQRREWNFNLEAHLRQKLAYDLMRFAGVSVPTAGHVVLAVNGVRQGLYLQYEDPDNKAFLKDEFGSDAGDLFKAAFDIPGQPKKFALLTVLGPDDADYFLHYDKKLNDEGTAEQDYASLRAFISGLNDTPDAAFPAWLRENFDVERFTNYLVVSNFIANWDSYPQRPKNYWLYRNPVSSRWVFIPWDLDATFQTEVSYLAPMGPEASIFHEFDHFEGDHPNEEEGTERPLVRRMMTHTEFRTAYVARYRELLDSWLAADYLYKRLEALDALLTEAANDSELSALSETKADMCEFVERRHRSVRAELDAL